MHVKRAIAALGFFTVFAAAGGTVWAKGHGGGHGNGHHRHHSRAPVLYPYGYTPAPVNPYRYRASCARNPELEECVRERERLLYPQPGNASG